MPNTTRLTAFDASGLELINRQLETFDLQKKQIANLTTQTGDLLTRIASLENQKQTTGANNLTFTWTGPSGTISWAQGFVEDRQGNIYPVAAGSLLANASTHYWYAWNPSQRSMSQQQLLTQLTALSQLLIVCGLMTGTSGQTAAAGGGGTDPGGVGVIGKDYALL